MRKFVDQIVEFVEECDETFNAVTNQVEAGCHMQGETSM